MWRRIVFWGLTAIVIMFAFHHPAEVGAWLNGLFHTAGRAGNSADTIVTRAGG